MVKLRRIAVVTAVVLGGFTLLYFTAVLIGGLITVNGPEDGEEPQAEIFLDNNGRHFDIWLSAEYCGFIEEHEIGSGGWYGFGWGDSDFFLNTPYAADVKPGILLKALFLPSRPVLAVQYSDSAPRKSTSVVSIPAQPSSIEAAAAYIESWFLSSADGLQKVTAYLIHPSYTGYVFYESRGRYSIFFTSNNWVNKALKKAGLKTGLWTPLTFGVGGGE